MYWSDSRARTHTDAGALRAYMQWIRSASFAAIHVNECRELRENENNNKNRSRARTLSSDKNRNRKSRALTQDFVLIEEVLRCISVFGASMDSSYLEYSVDFMRNMMPETATVTSATCEQKKINWFPVSSLFPIDWEIYLSPFFAILILKVASCCCQLSFRKAKTSWWWSRSRSDRSVDFMTFWPCSVSAQTSMHE